MRIVAAVLSALVLTALAVSAAGARPDALPTIKGTATFPATSGATHCTFGRAGAKIRERCVPGFGTFQGTPGPAGTSVSWLWLLETSDGDSTGSGTEEILLKLNFGEGKLATLSCKGTIKPVGRRTPSAETTVGTGTCTVNSASGFARAVAVALAGQCKVVGRSTCPYKSKYVRNGNVYDEPTITILKKKPKP